MMARLLKDKPSKNVMKVNVRKLKIYGVLAVKLLGILIGCAAFWFIVIEFMWACYYAGIPM